MSLWEKYKEDIKFPKLEKDIEVDTLIIGGGITGLTTLYYLKDKQNVCLVDASKIGDGISKNTTGKVTYLQETVYSDLTNNIHPKVAHEYFSSQKEAISLLKKIIEKEQIYCDFEKVESFIFTNKESEIAKLKQEKNFLEQESVSVLEKDLPLNIPSKYAISVEDTYVFNPVKYLNHLSNILKEKQIYEHTKIKNISYEKNEYICVTDKNRIKAKKVVVACHYPFFIFPFLLPLKSHIEKSYLIACKTNEYEKFSCINVSYPSLSFRYYDDGKNRYKIYLASSHNTAMKQDDKKNFAKIVKAFSIQEEIAYMWSNVDIITDDKLPYIGEVKENLFLASGFNTWGMTNGILAAKILSDQILGIQNPYENLFSVKRKNLYKVKNFFSNITTSFIAFVGSKKKKKDWYSNHLVFKKENGKSIAIYTDEQGKKHTVYTTCPHMKCSLIFNEIEKTWDCPCHSSRFDMDGHCIKGPSVYDISYKKDR